MSSVAEEIADGLAEAREILREGFSGTITYVRRVGSSRIVLPTAVLTKPITQTETSTGAARREQAEDVLIAASELVDDGEKFEPARDDTIEVTEDGVTVIYGLQPPDKTAAVFDVTAVHNTVIQYRVHTKRRK